MEAEERIVTGRDWQRLVNDVMGPPWWALPDEPDVDPDER